MQVRNQLVLGCLVFTWFLFPKPRFTWQKHHTILNQSISTSSCHWNRKYSPICDNRKILKVGRRARKCENWFLTTFGMVYHIRCRRLLQSIQTIDISQLQEYIREMSLVNACTSNIINTPFITQINNLRNCWYSPPS